jgi:hypothetical protein
MKPSEYILAPDNKLMRRAAPVVQDVKIKLKQLGISGISVSLRISHSRQLDLDIRGRGCGAHAAHVDRAK